MNAYDLPLLREGLTGNELNLVRIIREPAHRDLIVTWREAYPRPYWNDPKHWEACRPNYEKEES